MPEQNSPKVFNEAFNSMLNYLKSQGINADDIQNEAGVPRATISNWRTGIHNKTIYNLEKILLNDIVSEEALNYFIEEVTRLLKYYRNYPYDYDRDEETVDENAELEDAVLGGSQGRKNLLKSGRIITPENFRRNREKMERIGHKGEEYVNAYLQESKNKGEIAEFEWVSKKNAISPYDFWISYGESKEYIDVKSTSGEFERKIHISLSELELMSSDTERYRIYRIFDLDENNRTAKLRIAEDVMSFAKGIREVFNGLPEGVCAEGISVDPSKSGLNFQDKIEEIQLPDEPEEES